MTATTFRICVYCGSRPGASPAYGEAARVLGETIGRRGWELVYGGGNVGLMGIVADAVLAHGGTAYGVIPRSLMDREVGHRGLTELHVVDTMHERKRMMAERADAFLALPGGIGTFEELFEVWTWRQLGYHDKPLGLLEVDGYYADLLRFLDRSEAQGFVAGPTRALLQVDTDPQRLLGTLHDQARHATAPDDYQAI
jgi:uncharacterized protein (TIGR00730 family)